MHVLLSLLLACVACLVSAAAAAQTADATAKAVAAAQPLRFGILPTGGPAESQQDWRPLLDDLSAAIGRPVESVSVSSYEGMQRAIRAGRVDVAFVSGRIALDAVANDDMEVFARLVRTDGTPGYRSVLISRRDGPVRDLDAVLAGPGRLRYARGEPLSVSGYMVPEAQLFARRGIASDLYFRAVTVDNHQNNALAVVNGEIDVASNNTADLERFAKRFPRQYRQLLVIWRSELIPHAVLVASRRLPPATRAAVRGFLVGYGEGPGEARDAQRRHLLRIHELAGFGATDNRALLPFAEIAHTLQMRQAMAARWVDGAARDARLERLRREDAALREKLAPARPRKRPPAPKRP